MKPAISTTATIPKIHFSEVVSGVSPPSGHLFAMRRLRFGNSEGKASLAHTLCASARNSHCSRVAVVTALGECAVISLGSRLRSLPMSKTVAAIAAVLSITCLTASSAFSAEPLRIATWNMEHLSEDGTQGCRERTDADYAMMRGYAERLNADVVAFQEVESVKAAARVFDPAKYQLIIEERPAADRFPCRGLEGRTLTRQAVGFAIRKGIKFDRAPDLTALQLGDPNLRSGVDVTIRAPGRAPLRLLAVHLKSGCASGDKGDACQTLLRQVPILENWIDTRATEGVRFAVLGDFNRRLARKDDVIWREIDDAEPANADLALAQGSTGPKCDPRFSEFIDHVVLDATAARDLAGFEEVTYAAGSRPSDHCPVVAKFR